MESVTTEITITKELEVVKLPFELDFSHNKNKKQQFFSFKVKDDRVICKVFVNMLYNVHLGHINKNTYLTLMHEMLVKKCDLLTDGRDYYTTGNQTIMILNEFNITLLRMKREYEQRNLANN